MEMRMPSMLNDAINARSRSSWETGGPEEAGISLALNFLERFGVIVQR